MVRAQLTGQFLDGISTADVGKLAATVCCCSAGLVATSIHHASTVICITAKLCESAQCSRVATGERALWYLHAEHLSPVISILFEWLGGARQLVNTDKKKIYTRHTPIWLLGLICASVVAAPTTTPPKCSTVTRTARTRRRCSTSSPYWALWPTWPLWDLSSEEFPSEGNFCLQPKNDQKSIKKIQSF